MLVFKYFFIKENIITINQQFSFYKYIQLIHLNLALGVPKWDLS